MGAILGRKHKIDVKSTADYSIFRVQSNNRVIDNKHVKRLAESMERKYIAQPILVNKDMEVIDGQHRLEALKQLGYEVPFIQGDFELSDMIALNTNQKNWNIDDYIHHHASINNIHYINLTLISNDFDISLSNVISIAQNTVDKNRVNPIKLSDVKDGSFEFDYELVRTAASEINSIISILDIKKHNKMLVSALSKIIQHKDYDHDKMIKKCTNNKHMFKYQINSDAYIDLFEDIYNFHNKYKVSLKYK